MIFFPPSLSRSSLNPSWFLHFYGPLEEKCRKGGGGLWRRGVVNKLAMCGDVLILEAYTEKHPPFPSTRRRILATELQASGGERSGLTLSN